MSTTEQITLSDGRRLTLREITGKELLTASRWGKDDPVSMSAAAVTLSIEAVDGQKADRLSNIVCVQAFMSRVKSKDWARVRAAYVRLNGGEDETDEAAGSDIVLSDGRKVVMGETNAVTEVIASKVANGDMASMSAAIVVLGIAEINGQKFQRPTTAAELNAFMSSITARDFARLSAAYQRMNGAEIEGEAVAAE